MNDVVMDFQTETMPNYKQVILPTDGVYGIEDVGNVRREADETNKVLSNGGVSSGEVGEDDAIQQEHDLPNEDDVEQEDDDIGTPNELKNSSSGVDRQGVNQNNGPEKPGVGYNLQG